MSNGKTNPTPAVTTLPGLDSDPSTRPGVCPAWCAYQHESGPHPADHHRGDTDLMDVTASANREQYLIGDSGVVVPEVHLALVQQTRPRPAMARQGVLLSISHPIGEKVSTCVLTLDEAELLHAHLHELLAYVGREGVVA